MASQKRSKKLMAGACLRPAAGGRARDHGWLRVHAAGQCPDRRDQVRQHEVRRGDPEHGD